MGDSIFLGTWVESLLDEAKTPSQLAAIENISGGSSTFTETLWTDNTGNYFVRVDTAGVISWTNMLGGSTTAPGTGAKPASGSGGSSGSLAETLWVDDTLAYFVRIDTGSAITWVTPTGAVPSIAPGTGLRPAAGASIVVDTTRYQAIAAGTGFVIGDYLSHIVTIDPATGVEVASFWLNVTQNTKLSTAPSAANITPIAPLPAGAATAALQSAMTAALGSPAQETGGNLASIAAAVSTAANQVIANTSLASILTKLSGVLSVSWSGQSVGVSSLPALPAGTNNVGFVSETYANLATSQVSVGATATLIVAARAGRKEVTIVNHGTTALYLGSSSGVTTSTGQLLAGVAGEGITYSGGAAIYGITASGSQTVSAAEVY